LESTIVLAVHDKGLSAVDFDGVRYVSLDDLS